MTPSADVPTLKVDAVIVGGGIQGLWLLADLIKNGYQAILLERMWPGFGQTGHSHVFLHEGHMFAGMLREGLPEALSRVGSVLKANGLWKAELKTGRLRNLSPLKSSFYIGWKYRIQADEFAERCKQAELPCEEVTSSPTDFGVLAEMEGLYRSEAICLDSKMLLENLLASSDLDTRVGYCEDIGVDGYESKTFRLVARRDRRNLLHIDTSALVLSAGAGNEKLVTHLFHKGELPLDLDATKQQTVKTFMLVIRHLKGSLPLVAGMFPDFGGIFVVSRKDAQNRTVWLVGDKQRKLVGVPGEIAAFDAVTWFENLRIELEQLFPELINHADDFEWGIYDATKAERWTGNDRFEEGGVFPGDYHLHKHPGAALWLTWPTLLTFAPMVASSIVSELKRDVPLGSTGQDWSSWDTFRLSKGPSECRWKTTPMLSWEDFIRCYSRSAVPARQRSGI